MNKNHRITSLYVYLSMSFVIILFLVLLSTVLYIYVINGSNIIDIFKENIGNNEIIFDIKDSLKDAIIYGVIIGVAFILVVVSHIINPLRKITEATKKVAKGDLSVKVDIYRDDEIGDLANNFNIMVNELNSIEYLRKDFISNISHELKTPIASIQGFTKLLADDNLDASEKNEYINIILEETTRLSNLSSNMVKLSKLENQGIITNEKEYRLDNQLRKAIIMLDEKINKKNIKVSLNSTEITIKEDEDLVMEIWLNLLNNSIKYTNENGIIDVSIIEEEKYVKVIIKDNGIGIDDKKQSRVFEKFYQAENSHATEGSGLGLAIVKRIVELIDAKIEFTSKKNYGTTFILYLKK